MPVLRVFVVFVLFALACGGPREDGIGDWTPVQTTSKGLRGIAWTDHDQLIVETAGGSRGFVAGVNLGPTIPGTFPGEQAIRREDFRRWFPQMRDVGLRAVRVYTIMPPTFYEELRRFNLANPSAPLLLVHGVWIPGQLLIDAGDLFDPEVVEGFKEEIQRAVAVVHGDATLPELAGHATGDYRADVSEWLISWVIGVELDPRLVLATDSAHEGIPAYSGEFFRNVDQPSPTETWLAEMLDHMASSEAERGSTMPLAFVNWPTTDPLTHPGDRSGYEDVVGVDANHIRPSDKWPGGYYASYHAYPYFPDFQRFEPGIANFQHRGRTDAYAGYLTALKEHHRAIPLVVTEFGVPAGMAVAHYGPQGRHQGGHSEQRQMAINAELLDTIREVGLAGGFVFEWADEWFKFTWNTIDYEIPWERRALWANTWTNEAHFGILAVEPGVRPVVTIDGEDTEWVDNGSQVILESPTGVREVRAVADEGFLYLRIRTDGEETWREESITIGLDLLSGGNGGLPGTNGIHAQADYAVILGPNEEGTVLVRASNDPYGIRYAWRAGYEDVDPLEFAEGSGVWNVQHLLVNHPLSASRTDQSVQAESIESGRLVSGISDPDSPHFDSRATWNGVGNVIEIRLPYQAIGFSDPSSLKAYRIDDDGTVATQNVERVGITVVEFGVEHVTAGYAWEPWQTPTWHERLKAGSGVLREALEEANSTRR